MLSCSLLRESVVLARLLMDWALKVVVLASFVSLPDMIVRVASNAPHRSAIVSCRTLFMFPSGAVRGEAVVAASVPRDAESSDCVSVFESGLQLLHLLHRIGVKDVSDMHDSFRVLEPNFERCRLVGDSANARQDREGRTDGAGRQYEQADARGGDKGRQDAARGRVTRISKRHYAKCVLAERASRAGYAVAPQPTTNLGALKVWWAAVVVSSAALG